MRMGTASHFALVAFRLSSRFVREMGWLSPFSSTSFQTARRLLLPETGQRAMLLFLFDFGLLFGWGCGGRLGIGLQLGENFFE